MFDQPSGKARVFGQTVLFVQDRRLGPEVAAQHGHQPVNPGVEPLTAVLAEQTGIGRVQRVQRQGELAIQIIAQGSGLCRQGQGSGPKGAAIGIVKAGIHRPVAKRGAGGRIGGPEASAGAGIEEEAECQPGHGRQSGRVAPAGKGGIA